MDFFEHKMYCDNIITRLTFIHVGASIINIKNKCLVLNIFKTQSPLNMKTKIVRSDNEIHANYVERNEHRYMI